MSAVGVAAPTVEGTAPTTPAVTGSCSHLTAYLQLHPQTPALGNRVASQSAALNSVAAWLGGSASPAAANLMPVIPQQSQPVTELQALLQCAATMREERRSTAGSKAATRRLARLQSVIPRCSTTNCNTHSTA